MINRRVFLKVYSLAFLSMLFLANIFSSKSLLPDVLNIRDSISIGYYPFVREELKGNANSYRPVLPEGGFQNCEGTTMGGEKTEQWIGETKWDLIHFNFGLHDLKHVDPQTVENNKSFDDPHQASTTQHDKNFQYILKKLKKKKAKLIFVTTTPYPDERLKPARKPGMYKTYNSIALRVIKKHKIFINDLNAPVMPRVERLQRSNNVRFSKFGSEKLSKAVVKSILKHL